MQVQMWHSSEVFFFSASNSKMRHIFSDWQGTGTGQPRGLFWYFRVSAASCLKSLVQVYSVPYVQEVLRQAYKHARVIFIFRLNIETKWLLKTCVCTTRLVYCILSSMTWRNQNGPITHQFMVLSSEATRLSKRSYQAICEKHFVSQG